MKISDTATPPTAFLMSSLVRKKPKSTKSHELNRRSHSRLTSLPTTSPIPINSYQIVPISSVWTNTTCQPSSPIISLINSNPTAMFHTPPHTVTLPSSTTPQLSDIPVYSSFKPFAPKVTTTFIPLNVGPTDHSHIVSESPIGLINKGTRQTGQVATHVIGDWVIRESSEPFRRKERHSEKPSISPDSGVSALSSSSSVNQWNTDDVCAFFKSVLGKSCFSSIIEEHLIDGTALLLLQEQHLVSIFKMQLGPRLKLLNQINKLKTGDLSAS